MTNELLRYFSCSQDAASSSAFIQQRQKINEFAFSSLFDLFVRKTDKERLYKGYRLLAADGSNFSGRTPVRQLPYVSNVLILSDWKLPWGGFFCLE